MSEPLLTLKSAIILRYGTVKNFRDKLTRNGNNVPLSKMYRIISGYEEAKPELKRQIARRLQTRIVELFPMEGSRG